MRLAGFPGSGERGAPATYRNHRLTDGGLGRACRAGAFTVDTHGVQF